MIILKNNKAFEQNLVMFAEDKKRFQSNKICWICKKLFVAWDNKVRDNDNITGKNRGSAYWSCNINFKLTIRVPVIHNL